MFDTYKQTQTHMKSVLDKQSFATKLQISGRRLIGLKIWINVLLTVLGQLRSLLLLYAGKLWRVEK